MADFLENIIIDGRVKRGTWKKFENHKIYAEWLGKKLGYTNMDDWYKITMKDFHNNYGHTMMANYYNCSPINFILKVYPDYKWLMWKFNSVLKGYWKNKDNHKIYGDWLFQEQGYTNMEDWYKITKDKISDNYGGGLFTDYYQNSLIKFLKEIYPEYEWLEWKHISTPNGYWKDIKNVKKYANWLFQKKDYTKMEDWYKLSRQDIVDNHGAGLLHNYNSSHIYFLKDIYKEYEWFEWKFNFVSTGYWDKIENHTKYVEWLFKELKYT